MAKQKKKKSVVKIVIDVLFSLLMVFIALIVTFSIIEKKTGKSITGYRIVWVLTDSMEDTIPQQSYILTKDVKPEDEIVIGDVITFVVEDPTSEIYGKYNTHRIIDINEYGQFITKGDHNIYRDEWPVNRDAVVAKYIKNLPFATFIGRFYAQPIGYVLTIVLVAGLVTAWFVIDHKKDKKALKEEAIQEEIKKEVERLEKEAKEKDIIK